MAELERDPATCCAPEQQTSCCEPQDKDGCCTPGESSCGCASDGGREDVREQVRARYAAVHEHAGAAVITASKPA
jgi:hypothetical protein